MKIRRRGYPTETRTFETKAAAERYAREIESEMDRGVFVSRTEAENTTLSELLNRYLREVTAGKKRHRHGDLPHPGHTAPFFGFTDRGNHQGL